MSKFNQTNTAKTLNRCGHVAYAMDDKSKLVSQVLTTFFGEPKYYGDTSGELMETACRILDEDPKFVSNLAVYARKEMHLRSVSHALTALLAKHEKGKSYVKKTAAGVIERPDDVTEILACYLGLFGKPIPNALKKALGAALGRFDAYQLSKYSGGNKSVKFRDVLRLAHPVPANAEQEKLFGMVLTDTLPVAERWETELSAQGNTREIWEKLIAEDKLGYMAMLRNLRNILKADPKNLDEVYKKLSDRERILHSKQLPFRFFSAYREICGLPCCTSKALDVLETAVECSTENLPELSGKTVVAIDTSGSMVTPISRNSAVTCADVARLLAVLVARLCEDSIVYTFDTRIEQATFSRKGGMIETAMHIPVKGGGTDLTLPLEKMLANRIFADRLILLSDNEINSRYGWTEESTCQSFAEKYRREINKNLWVHAIDLQGYGTQQFIGAKTNLVAGWSERILEFLALSEQGFDTQVKRISEYEF